MSEKSNTFVCKPIETAPWEKEVLLFGKSGCGKPHDRFVVNGYRVRDWHGGEWNDATGTPLRDFGWMPTHYAEMPETLKLSGDVENVFEPERMNETKTVYVAYTNTDCTEGRGKNVPVAVCELETTAKRLARKQYVQGSDGPVRKLELIKIAGKWFVPYDAINVIEPTSEDKNTQKRLDAKHVLIETARKAGLSDDLIASALSDFPIS